ncbi:MAG TPA: serine--tRNA ligase [Methanocorpusculum sp.]|nr:serine--tRNA ligase [Methanocorpusculum sp.]
MLDMKFVREHPEIVRADLEKRHDAEKLGWVGIVLELDKQFRELTGKNNELRARRNLIAKEINAIKKARGNLAPLLSEAKTLPQRIKDNEDIMEKATKTMRYYLMRLPNILHESVPYGKDETENRVIKKVGTPRTFDFEVVNHGELCVRNGWADFERAAKTSGAGFYFLKDNLALMDIALQRFAIDELIAKGYTLIVPPYMLNRKSYEDVTDLADFEKVMYKINGDDEYLIATAEHPMAAMYQDEIFEEKDLPLKMVGISPCFRREIGAHGLDSRGLFRVHQFTKVEQFIYSMPEKSWEMHEELLSNSEEIFTKLGIPYQVVNICTGDIGIVAAKKYDIEAWMPRDNAYREVVSCSNCTTYQACRLNIRVRNAHDFNSKQYLHTLNSTAIATSRALRCILENYQTEDGRVEIPKVLRPYMQGREFL